MAQENAYNFLFLSFRRGRAPGCFVRFICNTECMVPRTRLSIRRPFDALGEWDSETRLIKVFIMQSFIRPEESDGEQCTVRVTHDPEISQQCRDQIVPLKIGKSELA